MIDANLEYRLLTDWGSAVRIGINGTVAVLQALVAKQLLTNDEAIAIIGDLAAAAARQTSTSDAQKQVVAASYDQARELLRQI